MKFNVLSSFFILLVMSCTTNKIFNNSPTRIGVAVASFDYQGHRGCRGLMPENTIPAFLKAIELHVTTLEMDIVITKDKQVIISHEPFFNHEITTKADGSFIDEKDEQTYNIYKMTFAETKRYDVGLKPHLRFPQQQKMAVHKPLLSEVIDSAEARTKALKLPAIYYNIETKSKPPTDDFYHPKPEVFVDLIMAVVLAKHIEERVIIQSFDIRTLQYLHVKYSSIKTALLIEDFDKKQFAYQLSDLGFTPTIYSPENSLITPLLVRQCKEVGIKLIPWTVNEAAKIEALKVMGVDGIISDYPNLYNN